MKLSQTNRKRPLWVVVLAALAVVAAACGAETNTPAITGNLDQEESSEAGGGESEVGDEATADDDSDAMAADEDEEEAMSEDNDEPAADVGTDTDTEVPSRILSLSPTATESLFAIGAGDQVIGVDSLSNFPPEAPVTDIEAFTPSLEAIAALDPDLVIISFDPGDIVAGLDDLGIATLVQPTALSLDDAYAQIADLGIATGNEDGAAQVVAGMREDIDRIVGDVDADGLRLYHELDGTFFSATSSSFLGQLYALLGVENVADAADPDNESFGFPQLSVEYLIEADPQMIVITDQNGYGPEEVAARAGWDTISAVQNDSVVQVDADISSRWGPRIVEFLEVISEALADQLVTS